MTRDDKKTTADSNLSETKLASEFHKEATSDVAVPIAEKNRAGMDVQSNESFTSDKLNNRGSISINGHKSDDAATFSDWEGIIFHWKRKLEGISPHLLVVGLCVAVSLTATGNAWILHSYFLVPFMALLLRIIGVTLGVGLGLGLAAHVYDQLQEWHLRHHEQQYHQQLLSSIASSSQSLPSSVPLNTGSEQSLPSTLPRRPSSLHRFYSGSVAASSTKSMTVSGSQSNINTSTITGNSNSLLRQQHQQQHRWNQDESPYVVFMTSAGYELGDQNSPLSLRSGALLRGQVLRQASDNGMSSSQPSQQRFHRFTDVQPPEQQYAVHVMEEEWPLLSPSIRLQLGRWIEHILRDYVASWYSMIDAGCHYQDERTKRMERQQQQQHEATETKESSQEASVKRENRVMIVTTAGLRPCPTIQVLYHTVALCLGNLAMRVEGINVMELILLKWTKVLAHTFKVYRLLRKSVTAKAVAHSHHNQQTNTRTNTSSSTDQQQDNNVQADGSTTSSTRTCISVSEMSMTREFMLAGKLHRAITFGLDVPSLLFADSTGKDCGWESKQSPITPPTTPSTTILLEDAVLEARLLHSKMLNECELDYNRVVAHGILRALLPRHEYSSMVVRSLMTEIMAGCVLGPIMSCFCPQSLNEWIIAGMESLMKTSTPLATTSSESNTSITATPTTLQPTVIDEPHDSSSLSHAKTVLFVETRGDGKNPNLLTSASIPGHSSGSSRGSNTRDAMESVAPDEDEMDESFGHNDETEDADDARERMPSADDIDPRDVDDEESSASLTGDQILPLLAMALIELQQFMDFEECREARKNQQQIEVDWDDPGYRAAVLQLVLIIEAALLHGRRADKSADTHARSLTASVGNDTEEPEESIEMTLPEYQSLTLSQMLMEMTSDMEAFEERVAQEEKRLAIIASKPSPQVSFRAPGLLESEYKPSASELSTLRTLIAAWLHTGLIHRVISLLIRATSTLLSPYYHMHAFLRDSGNAGGFARQLKQLDGVDILVDTISVLSSASLDLFAANVTPMKAATSEPDVTAQSTAASAISPKLLKTAFTKSMKHFTETNLHRFMTNGSILPSLDSATPDELSPTSFMAQFAGTNSTPRFLDFQRNAAFAASLRSERERRLQSWAEATSKKDNDDGIHIVCVRKGASEDEIARHRELHHLARTFYSGTTLVGIRDGTRRKESGELDPQSGIPLQPLVEKTPISLLTVEMACPRRRIEVPDDDSSFLLRAQPRPLSAVGVHRDQRNHEQSYKCFAASYEEPALRPGSNRFNGGRYIRLCLLRYYPSDRTAAIVIQNDSRRIDQRKGRPVVPDSISIRSPSSSVLTNEFLRERHLCHKWNPKGSAPRSGSILASSVMEPTEFNAAPRSGKAFDFVYRVSLFESPMVELGGKRFTVHDSSVLGTHRADASALEMSDATLSAALAIMGRDWEIMVTDGGSASVSDPLTLYKDQDRRPLVELGPDGYPIVWMKFQRKHDDKSSIEIKPYRTSFVRAALLLTGARQEAQLQCLVKCVRAGSAKSATKALTESQLKPTVRLLEYASSRSREMQSMLLRDLKFGINHIDKDQLRRNHLLHPRYPASLRSLSVSVDSATYAKDCGVPTQESPSTVLFRIRCVAVVELLDNPNSPEVATAYADSNGKYGELYREEWAVFRSFKDFQALHKHLKSQVASAEASGSAGTRIAGALAAAGVSGIHHRQRKALIPSLGSANKAGALGVNKKAISKRRDVLDGYLRHLLSPNHLLNQTPEILLFIGASHPFPREVGLGEPPYTPARDFLGRIEMTRSIFVDLSPLNNPKVMTASEVDNPDVPQEQARSARNISTGSLTVETVKESEVDDTDDESALPKSRTKEEDMIPSIRARVDKVPLSQVRHSIFELVRYQFGFDNASFLRSRMLSALKTASFAVTTASEFRKTLYDLHKKLLNAEAVADWIKFGLDMLWPDGVFIQFSKPLSPEQLQALSDQALKKLHEGFPDALRTVLGQELTRDGLEMMHEMFQNRVVVKSMAYMLFDLLWLEAFPELDVLTGGAALDMD